MKRVIKNKKKMQNTMMIVWGVFALALFTITRFSPTYAENGIKLDGVIDKIAGTGEASAAQGAGDDFGENLDSSNIPQNDEGDVDNNPGSASMANHDGNREQGEDGVEPGLNGKKDAQDSLAEFIPLSGTQNDGGDEKAPQNDKHDMQVPQNDKGDLENLDNIQAAPRLRNAPKNNCGNGIIDEGEDCKTCPADVGGCSEDPIQLFRQGSLLETYTLLSQAINEAQDGDVIYLLQDISVTGASVVSGKSLTINGNNHTITRAADITTITVNEDSSLILHDIVITDNAVNFAPNRYDSLINAKSDIPLCLGGVKETRDENGEVIESVCATENVDVAKTNPQIYSVGDIYGDNLTISNSLNSKGSAAIIVEKGGIEMVNSNFIHNGARGTSNAGRGGAIRVGPNTAANIVDESPITKILFSGCYFEGNYGGTYGGVMAIHYAPEIVTVDNCIFSGNTARYKGGAIQIVNIGSKLGGSVTSFWISSGSNFPIGTMYVNNSDFYNNWCGNDGAAIQNDDIHLEVDGCYFEHNYGTQPLNTSVGVISCEPGMAEIGGDKTGRGGVYREYKIKNSSFKDTNTSVFGDHNTMGAFFIDNCSFEKQSMVILTYNGIGEIKNSTIKNSNPFGYCGINGRVVRDVDIIPHSDYLERMELFGESTFKLENNTYSNDCTTNEYFQVRNINYTTGVTNIIIENEEDTKIFVHKDYYDSSNIQGTDEIYYGVTIVDGGRGVYIKKNKFYNFDEFNGEIKKFSSRGGYQLDSGKTMLFYLDSGHTELWSGSISTTTNLYGKETNIYNIDYQGVDGVAFEGITHTYKFNNLNHTQYLEEHTPYTLNIPSRNGYKFEGRYLDGGYTTPVTSIEKGRTGDITLYAKWLRIYNRSGGGGRRTENNSENKGDDSHPSADNPENKPEENLEDKSKNSVNEDKMPDNLSTPVSQSGTNSRNSEIIDAHQWAYNHNLTQYKDIKDARLSDPLNRSEMAKITSIFATQFLGKEPDESKQKICSKYSDMRKVDNEMKYFITQSCELGYMGYESNGVNLLERFRPYTPLTLAEASTVLSRIMRGGEYALEGKNWYKGHLYAVYNHALIDDIRKPNSHITREQAFLMLYRMYKNMEK